MPLPTAQTEYTSPCLVTSRSKRTLCALLAGVPDSVTVDDFPTTHTEVPVAPIGTETLRVTGEAAAPASAHDTLTGPCVVPTVPPADVSAGMCGGGGGGGGGGGTVASQPAALMAKRFDFPVHGSFPANGQCGSLPPTACCC